MSFNNQVAIKTVSNELIRVKDIEISNRFRRDVGDVSDLAISIKNNGLIHPISITRDSKLVAGRRRIEAFKELGLETIPVTITDMAIKEDRDISKRRIKIAQKRLESVNAVSERLKELAKLQPGSVELLWEEEYSRRVQSLHRYAHYVFF